MAAVQPGVIELIITPEGSKLLVDGEEFPFDILARDVEISQVENEAAYVRVSIPTRSILVRADLPTGPTDVVVVEDPNLEPVTKPEGVSWYHGYVFTMHQGLRIPDHVTALFQVDHDQGDETPYLVRKGRGDNWAWGQTPSTLDRQTNSFSMFANSYRGEQFQVVKVRP